MGLAELLAADRRRAILEALNEDVDGRLGEPVLRSWVAARVDDVDRAQLRAELRWLEQSRLIRLDKLDAGAARELWVAVLLEAGRKVAEGRHHDGVARREGY